MALTDLLARVPMPDGVGCSPSPPTGLSTCPARTRRTGRSCGPACARTCARGHPMLAAALAAAPLVTPDPVAWWRAYVGLLVPAVLRCWLSHGVVHEAHLQNVVVVLDSDRRPVRMLLRDLEGSSWTPNGGPPGRTASRHRPATVPGRPTTGSSTACSSTTSPASAGPRRRATRDRTTAVAGVAGRHRGRGRRPR
ncbi:ferric iron reductase [Micromonospora sp. M12]